MSKLVVIKTHKIILIIVNNPSINLAIYLTIHKTKKTSNAINIASNGEASSIN